MTIDADLPPDDPEETEFTRLMDAMQTLITLTPGQVLTAEDIADLHLVDEHNREEAERAVDAFMAGYNSGLERALGADAAKLVEERDVARSTKMLHSALRDNAFAQLDEANKKLAEFRATFDLRWEADRRATRMWQEANPGNDLTWPDHADMVVWLLQQLDQARGTKP